MNSVKSQNTELQNNRLNFMKSFIIGSFPMIIQCVVNEIVSASDAIMVGTLDHESLAAVTLAGQIVQIFNFFIIALCVGSSALAAQYYGNKDYASVNKVLNITLQVSITGGILFFIGTMFFPDIIMSLYTNETALITKGIPYLRIVSFSFIFMSFSQIYMNLMKNTGKSTLGSVIGILTVFLNIGLNAILIFGLLGFKSYGVSGAALGTSISRFIEVALTMFFAFKSDIIPFRPKELFVHYKTMSAKFRRYTLPSMIQHLAWIIANSLCMAILGHLGSDVVAASAIALISFNIIGAISLGYARAAGINIGQNLGKGDIKSAKQNGDTLLLSSVFMGVIVCILVCLLNSFIVNNCGKNMSAESVKYLRFMLYFCGFRCIGKYIVTTMAQGILPAGGDIHYLMKTDIINMWLIVLPLGYISAFVLKLNPAIVYAVLNLPEYYILFFMVRHYKQYKWAKNLTRKEWADPSRFEDTIRRRIFENMPLGIMVIGNSGKISMVNQECARLLYMDVEAIDGSYYTDLFMTDKNNEAFADIVLEAVNNKTVRHKETVDYKCADSSRKLIVESTFIEEEDSKIGVCLMISER